MDPKQNPEKLRISPKKRVLFGLILVLVGWGIAEGVHHFIATNRFKRVKARFESQKIYREDDRLGYSLKPGTWTNLSPGWEAVVQADGGKVAEEFIFTVNSREFRGPNFTIPRPPKTVRLVCFGGSTTFGTGCPRDDQTYPQLLARALNEKSSDQKIEILNAGVPGYRTTESIINLNKFSKNEVDIALLYHAINDIVRGDDGKFYSEPLQHSRPPSRVERYRRRMRSSLFEVLISKIVGSEEKKIRKGTGLLQYPNIDEGFETNLKSWVQLCHKKGIVPVLLTFETRLKPNLNEEQKDELLAGPIFKIYFPTYSQMAEALKKYNQIIRKVAESEGVALIDLEGKIPYSKENWIDFCHLNARGTRLMVDLIRNEVETIIDKR